MKLEKQNGLKEGYPSYTHSLTYFPNFNFRGGIDEMVKALDGLGIDALEAKASNFGDVTQDDIREHRREILDKGWDIQPSYDTSIKGANEVFICRKIKKYKVDESLQERKNKPQESKESSKVRDAIDLINGDIARRQGYKLDGDTLILGNGVKFKYSKLVIDRLKELGYDNKQNESLGIDMSKKQLKEDYISGENGLDMWQDDYMINADSYSKEYRDNFLKIQKLKKEIKAAFNNCKTVKEANDCYKESVEKVWDLAEEIYNAFGGRGKTPVGISDTLDYFEDAIGDFEDKALTRIERETPKDESLKEGKDMDNKLTEAVDKNKLADFIKKAVEDLKISDAYSEIAPTWFFDMGAPNGLHLVIGYDNADNYYAEDLEHLALDKSGKFVVCAKLAVNVDDMQDDFDWDWYMPFDSKTGDVWDTQTTIANDEDYDAFAQNFIDEFEKMKDLDIDEDGAIIDEPVEESCDKKPMKESVEDDLYVMYWIDEDHRDQGIADYFYDIADIEDGKEVVDRLIDFEDYACAELLSGEDVVLYGRDADDTWGDLDESCKKEEKSLTESADQDDIRSAIYDTLRISGIDMQDILCDLVDTALSKAKRGGDVWDACTAAVDEGMTNLADQWKAYQFYCDMGDDKDIMWSNLTEDVFRVTSAILKNDDVEDDHDDEGRDDPMTGDDVWESLDNEVPMNEDELWESLNKLDDQPVADDVLDEVKDKRTAALSQSNK